MMGEQGSLNPTIEGIHILDDSLDSLPGIITQLRKKDTVISDFEETPHEETKQEDTPAQLTQIDPPRRKAKGIQARQIEAMDSTPGEQPESESLSFVDDLIESNMLISKPLLPKQNGKIKDFNRKIIDMTDFNQGARPRGMSYQQPRESQLKEDEVDSYLDEVFGGNNHHFF